MSSNYSLSMQKYRYQHRLSSMKNEKHQYRSRILLLPLKMYNEDILASVKDGLRGIFPSEANLIRGKVVVNIWNNMRNRLFLTKKEHMALQRLKKDPSIKISKADKGNITTVLDKEWYDHKNKMLDDQVTYIHFTSN